MHVAQGPWITGEIVLNIVNDALWIDPTETLWITIARSIMRYQKVQKHTFIMVFQCERKSIKWLWKWKSHASIMRKTCKKREWQIEDRSIYMSLQCEHWSVVPLASVNCREYDTSLSLFDDTQNYCCYRIEQIKKGPNSQTIDENHVSAFRSKSLPFITFPEHFFHERDVFCETF
jgi:hypothetical protein